MVKGKAKLGNTIVFQQQENYMVCHIKDLSGELEDLIRQYLSQICHGKSLAEKGLSLYTYQNTIKQFNKRYQSKPEKIRKGMIGELLVHVLVREYLKQYEPVSPFFNLEEKSQRKGFDLLLVSKSDGEIWITEVKSGEAGAKKCPNKATRSFLHTAKRDLKLRLNKSEDTFWLNAINTVNAIVNDSNDYKDAVIKILDQEGSLAANDQADSKDNNVILTSVLFHDVGRLSDFKMLEKVTQSILGEGLFKNAISFSIQKCTYQRVADFIAGEEANG